MPHPRGRLVAGYKQKASLVKHSASFAGSFRSNRGRAAACCLLALVLGTAAANGLAVAADDSKPVESAKPLSRIGQKVADFALKDSKGVEYRLSELKDAGGQSPKLTVVAFLGTECPLAKLYGPRLTSLQETYAARGVAFVALNANRQDSLADIAQYVHELQIAFPVLKDAGNHVADAMGAQRTPEVFVLDADRVVRYHGRIDDQYSVGAARKEPSRRDLALALDQLLESKGVEVAETKAAGCYIGRVRTPKVATTPDAVTWSNQIVRVFQKHCVQCHRDGEIAPFSLTDYNEAVGWAETIRESVQERRMPPWHADPKHGHFKNERRLSGEEIALIEKWIAAGTPEGNAADLPKPLQFTEGWQLDGPPDVVLSMNEAFNVPAEGTVDYKYFTVDTGFTEDKWIRAAEVQPGARNVVHHVLVLIRPQAGAAPGAGGGEFLAGYVPGMRVRPYPDGMAKLIPKGSKLVFQMHYTPNGTPEKDISRVGFQFADPQDISHVVVTSRALQQKIAIPPGDSDYMLEAFSKSHDSDLLLLGMMPHMHVRGKSFAYEAHYPDGKKETLLNVPRYDFNWQTGYALAEPLTMPAGTRIRCEAHYDNSRDNPANPDPTQTVRWGDQTWNEMMIGYFDVAVPLGERPPGRQPRLALATAEARRKRAEELVKTYDANKDGRVQKDEVPARVAPIFKLLDADSNGEVTIEEIMKANEALLRGR
ncbi:MAG: redoxin domain-containing protein [Planctomycetaceae bacterium]|nr:redoxin domain-containing protein [Planctomycetaceae bacterium]